MIPKIIHYCWFGRKPLPVFAKKCISSWEKYLPDYEIKEWNEDNFDVNIISYTKEAYIARKYAFVSDYARLWILYNYGGIYFDTDVEVIRSMDDIILKGSFMGFEYNRDYLVNPGLGISAIPKLSLYKELLDIYDNLHFNQLNPVTIVTITTRTFEKYGLSKINRTQKIADIIIYPTDYFAPKDLKTKLLKITSNTYSIHHYDASWITPSIKTKFVRLIFGRKGEDIFKYIYYKIKSLTWK